MIFDNPRYEDYNIIRNKIVNAKEYQTKTSLYKSLSTKVTKSKFDKVIQHMFETNKVIKTKDRKIVWVRADTPKIKKLLSESVLFV